MSKGKKYSKEFDAQFEAFLNESLSTGSDVSLDTGRLSKVLDGSHNFSKFSAILDDDEDESVTQLDLEAKSRFLKKPAQKVAFKSPTPSPRAAVGQTPVNKMDESALNEDFGFTNGDVSSLDGGKDTLEELEDKKRFFQKLEEDSNQTLDYGRLNKELDQDETLDTSAVPGDTAIELVNNDNANEIGENRNGDVPKLNKDRMIDKPKEQGMLSQVSLLDSTFDSTFDKRPSNLRGTLVSTLNTKKGGDSREGSRKTTNGNTEKIDRQLSSGDRDTPVGQLATGDLVGADTYLDALPPPHRRARTTSGDTEHNVSDPGDVSYDTSTTRPTINKASSGFGNTDTRGDLEAVRNEMRKYGVTHQASFDSTSAILVEGFDTLDNSADRLNTDPSGARFTESRDPAQRFAESREPETRFSETQEFDTQFGNSALGQDSSMRKDTVGVKRTRNVSARSADGASKTGKDKYAHVKSSGYNQKPLAASNRSMGRSLSSSGGRVRNKVIRFKSKEEKAEEEEEEVPVMYDGRSIMESLNSLSNFISARFSSDSDQLIPQGHDPRSRSPKTGSVRRKPVMQSTLKQPEDDLRYWQEMYREERKQREKIEGQVSDIEKDFEAQMKVLKEEHDQILYKLKQENFILASKIEESRRRLLSKARESGETSESHLAELEMEIKEQESLLLGYQAENEKMYEELKNLQQACKTTEERLMKENIKLKADLVKVREECNQKEAILKDQRSIGMGGEDRREGARIEGAEGSQVVGGGSGSAVLGSAKIAQLENELKLTKSQLESLKNERTDVEKKVEELLRANKDLEEELRLAKDCQTLESKAIEERYKKELEALRKKLRWYAENQQLLDDDVMRLKNKEEELRTLRNKVEELTISGTGKKKVDVTNFAQEKGQDSKRIQDLQRQVKELENILRKRHPNSLPVLMWAASNVPGEGNGDGGGTKTPSVLYLESRIRKLEEEIEEKDEESKRTIRSVEQRYNAMKLTYEERIDELESRMTDLRKELEFKPAPHSNVSTVQKELGAVKEKHKRVCTDYEQEINNLRAEVLSSKTVKPVSGKTSAANSRKHAEEISMLKATIQRLVTEKSQLTTDLRNMTERLAKATVKLSVDGRQNTRGGGKVKTRSLSINDVSADLLNKDQQDLVTENKRLRLQVNGLRAELDQQNSKFEQMSGQYEQRERLIQEKADKMILDLRSAYEAEVQGRVTASVLQNSSSTVTQLNNQVQTQQLMIEHLKSQVSQMSRVSDELSALKQINTSLEAKLKKINSDLIEAKRSHTPQMHHFEELKSKICQIEERHRLREDQLQQLIHNNHLLAVQDREEESNKWRRVLESKQNEIDRFREELDSILNVLRELKRQGVTIPYSAANHR